MLEIIQREAVYLWYYFDIQFSQIFWYWVLGMVLGSAVSVFLKDRIHSTFRSLGEKRLGIFGIVIASILGIASPLCMYGTIPIAASFSKSGIKDDWLAAFMMSSILLNPQLIIYSAALGQVALVVRIASCSLCGIAAGLLVRIFYRKKVFFNFDGFEEPKSRDTDPNIFLRFVKNLGRNIKATGLYFLFGIVLSAVFQRYMSQDMMTDIFGGNEAWGVLMAATIGVPLYACGGGDNTAFAGMAGGWHEHGKRGGIHADRTVYEDYKSWRGKDCAGNEKVYSVYCICYDFFAGHGTGGKSDYIVVGQRCKN